MLVEVAREIWGNRNDQKFGGNRRWRQLGEEFPDLAAAARPASKGTPPPRTRTELDEWRDDQEEEHKHFERWARSQTSARSPFYYSGGRTSVMRDAESTGAKWMKPYGCWRHTDRGRWARATGAGADQTTWPDSHSEHQVRGGDLRKLHEETGGNYTIEGDGVRDNQLEVCRLCGTQLDFERDDEGKVIRKPGEQPEYCSKQCKLDVYAARRRAQRRIDRPKPEPKPFDLAGVYVAGIGKLDVAVDEWNRLQARSRPEAYRLAFKPAPWPRPWFNPPKVVGGGKCWYTLPVHRMVVCLRGRPCRAADRWIKAGPRTQSGLPADRIARRYGTGGTPKPPEQSADCDRVSHSWRYPARRSTPTTVELKQTDDRVWRIAS